MSDHNETSHKHAALYKDYADISFFPIFKSKMAANPRWPPASATIQTRFLVSNTQKYVF